MDYVIVSTAIKLMTFIVPGFWIIIIMKYILDKKQWHRIAYCTLHTYHSEMLFGNEIQNFSSPFSNFKSIIMMMICAQNHFITPYYELWRWNYYYSHLFNHTVYRASNTIRNNSYCIVTYNGAHNSIHRMRFQVIFRKKNIIVSCWCFRYI